MQRLSNQKRIPKQHIITIVVNAYDKVTPDKVDASLFQYTGIEYTKHAAYLAAIEHIKKNVPTMYQDGENHGFQIAAHQEISLSTLQIMFKRKMDEQEVPMYGTPTITQDQLQPALEIKVADLTDEQKEVQKIMQEIIETKSEELLEKHKEKLSVWEIAYLQDELAK